MRTLVDIPENHLEILDSIGQKESLSRAELVRRAISNYLDEREKRANADINQYYGFLADVPDAFDGLGGVEYQRQIRSEWDDRDQKYSKWGLHDSAKQQPITGYPEPSTKKDKPK